MGRVVIIGRGASGKSESREALERGYRAVSTLLTQGKAHETLHLFGLGHE
jgi:hypothetical protein